MVDSDIKDDVSLYANLFGFLGCPLSHDPLSEPADVAVLGVPYDLGTTGRAGTRSGPAAIRQASGNLRWEEARWPWPYALADHLKVIDCGDLVYAPGDSAAFSQALQDRAMELLRSGKTLLSFGGDHFVTLPLLRAHHAVHGELALIHFDAHTDTYEQGGEFDHGTMFYRAPREGLIDPACSVQVGIRTEYEPLTHGFAVLDADWVNNQGWVSAVEAIRERVGSRKAYLTFDIDCLDPAFAPGTGTPVAGGLASNTALQILRGLKGLDIVGMDVVEVAPAYDHAEITALAAATLSLELLYLQVERPG
ncbi:MAG: agmatinase [Proteobacteria bacterium]|jgi:agmatinase|nr:agmatinase [Pseudomonadota bacterium]|tara:strand:- start:119 stop:1039 length:921 start_codon:yes stop_codon:yes gene_type:complete